MTAKWYLIGRIFGRPEFEAKEEFRLAHYYLASNSIYVVNPMQIIHIHRYTTKNEVLRRRFSALIDCTGVYILNLENNTDEQVNIELATALIMRKEIRHYEVEAYAQMAK